MMPFDMVGEFHAKFGLPVAGTCGPPGSVEPSVFMFRYQFILEEVGELLAAYRRGDLPGVADALADLEYVLLGTAHFFGVPHSDVLREVHRANMSKVRAEGSTDPRSRRASALDVVKPAGWTPPRVDEVLRAAGWEEPT